VRERERERDYTFKLLLSATEGDTNLSSNVNGTGLFAHPLSLSKYTGSVQCGTTCKRKRKINTRMQLDDQKAAVNQISMQVNMTNSYYL
jgi:hypothetical protein